MPARVFILAKRANKQLKKLPIRTHIKVVQSFRELKQNPLAGTKLEGKLNNNYKFRIGDYRIVYKFNPKESMLEVLKIEHRQGVYK